MKLQNVYRAESQASGTETFNSTVAALIVTHTAHI